MKSHHIDITHKNIALLGFGKENRAVYDYLKDKDCQITICDRSESLTDLPDGVTLQLGEHYLADLSQFDLIFRSPGIPYHTREIQAARQADTIISSQTQLFLSLCPAKVIGVTGTKGKSTTTALIAYILQQAQKNGALPGNAYSAGNIGLPPISLLPNLTTDDWVVLELSSFQLQDATISPHIAVVLNVTVDHLDHHRDEAEYISAKKNIIRYQLPTDKLVVSLDSLTSTFFADETPAQTYYFSREKSVDQGTFVERRLGDDVIILRLPGQADTTICKTEEVRLLGAYNLENVTAAVTAAALAGADSASIAAGVTQFNGLPHRLQYIAEKQGIRYYDDSKSTTPDSTIAAVLSFAEPVTLIVGGSGKGADFTDLVAQVASSSVTNVLCIGQEGERLMAMFEEYGASQSVVPGGDAMAVIVAQATAMTDPGGVVLLSPAAASFDMFTSAEDRGDQFQTVVQAL